MGPSVLSLVLVLSVALSCLDAAPTNRLKITEVSNGKGRKMMTLQRGHRGPTPGTEPPAREKRSQMEKRRCNTATCVTQRLADFLVRSSSNYGPIFAPTNVGSYTYGKRDIVGLLRRESFDYIQN
ncbi:islet amyloid polypeptide [Rhinoderma darwinii]|uniref:islet amyloid polypeptide n=1 Tax=Rhinoderma darwinii TaxID=43563 RepID=UPI003F66982D